MLRSTNSSKDPGYGLAVAEVTALLGRAPVLPGAVASRQAPVPALDESYGMPGTVDEITEVTWWTAPEDMSEAIAYFDAHVPSGVVLDGGMTASGNVPLIKGLLMDNCKSITGKCLPTLEIDVTAFHGGVAVTAAAATIWTTARTPENLLGTYIGPVGVTLVRQTDARKPQPLAPTVHATLTGPVTGRLARMLDALPTLDPNPRTCGASQNGDTDTLVFHPAGGKPYAITLALTECGITTVSQGPGKDTLLVQAPQVDQAVVAALGYGTSYPK